MAIDVAAGAPVDWDWQLADGLFFGGMPPNVVIDSTGVQWAMGGLDGWDSPDLRRSQFDRQFASGATFGTAYYSPRALSGKGLMVAPTQAVLEDAMERLRLAAPINTDVPLIRNETVQKYVMVRRSGRLIIDQIGYYGSPAATFDLGLVAGDPRKYALLTQFLPITAAFEGGGALFPWAWPVLWTDPGTIPVAELSNHGTAPAPVRFTLYGPLSSPVLLDRVSRYRLGLSLDIPDGAAVDIDTELGTILMDGDPVYDALQEDVLEPFLIPERGMARIVLLGTGAGRAVCSTSDTWE